MTDDGEPGYCIACRDWHMLTPVPEWGGGACQQCQATRRLDPPEPGSYHVCNTSDRLKPGHPDYRRCTCGQWFHSTGGYWYRVPHPPARWLREHGMSPGDFWNLDDEPQRRVRWFEELGPGRPSLITLLRWLFSGRSLLTPRIAYITHPGHSPGHPSTPPGLLCRTPLYHTRITASRTR